MTKLRYFACAITVLLAATSSNAQQAKPRSGQGAARWAQEPSSFLGIKLGEPMAIKSCRETTDLCLDDGSTNRYAVFSNLPDLGFRYTLTSLIEEGKPISIELKTDHANYSALLSMLKQRFGLPQKAKTEAIQTRMGMKTSSTDSIWHGQKVSMLLNERHETIDNTRVVVMDRKLADELSSRQETEMKSKANAF
ncbi:hypothetical protein [Cupriavidus metallidurans]|nr:hypothetical protein [Cupriavidus metallidurans]QGS30203.1 hypothetical protein FOB83_15640 [Cupriavidus metallidurans]